MSSLFSFKEYLLKTPSKIYHEESIKLVKEHLITLDPSLRESFMEKELVEVSRRYMKDRLEQSRSRGRVGWYLNSVSIDILKDMLKRALDDDNMVDVMVISAMINYKS